MQFLTPRHGATLAKTASRFWAISLLVGAFATCSLSAVAQVCPFDDGNSTLANEGLVMTRYALGLRGNAMVASTAFVATDAPTIESNIACPGCGLNITGTVDGSSNPMFTATDATIISRKIAGFKGAELTNGLNLGTGARNSPAAVQSFLLAGCGVGALPVCLPGQVISFASNGTLKCGNTPSTSTTLLPSSGTQVDISMAIPVDGRPVIAFVQGGKLAVAKCGNSACTAGNVITFNVDAAIANAGSWGSSIAVPADGLPIISYFGGAAGGMRIVKCGTASCNTGNTATSIDLSNASSGHFSSIAVPADGLPVVSYHDGQNNRLRITKCSNATCTVSAATTTADTGGGAYSSLAIGADGLPIVSYLNGTFSAPAGLKILKCGNASCSSGSTIATLDASALSGASGALVVPSDGLPMVSYQAGSPGYGLRVVKCGNAACTSGNTLTLVDAPAGGVWGNTTALVAAPDGRPVLIHSEGFTGAIRAVKCGNSACSSGNIASNIASAQDGNASGIPIAIAMPADAIPLLVYAANVGVINNSKLTALKCSNAGCLAP